MSATILAVSTVLSGCRDKPEGAARAEASASPLASPATDGTISAGELAAAPAQYFGRQVSVKAEVEQVISSNLYTLDDDRLGTPDIVVLDPNRSAALLRKGDDVIVTGTVKPFVWADIHRDYNWLLAKEEVVAEFETRPMVIATDVRRVD
jgi:hypothetical protein